MSAYTHPVVMPISRMLKKSAGVLTRLMPSQTSSAATSRSPTELMTLGRGIRVAKDGAVASAATGGATLLRQARGNQLANLVRQANQVRALSAATILRPAEVAELVDA